MSECAYLNRILNMSVVLNMPKFRVKQGSHYTSVTQRSEYDRICHDSGLNVTLVLNIPGF